MDTERALRHMFDAIDYMFPTEDVHVVAYYLPKLAAELNKLAKVDPQVAKVLKNLGVTE